MSEPSNKPRVLIVDDEAPIRELLAQMLSDDCVCVTSESAEAAIREINGTAFDLVISDVHLGGMSGVELVPMVQKKSPDTVVMMISGAQSVDTAIDAIRVGVFDYIRKPFDFDQVIAAVKRAVQHQRLLAERHRRTLELQTLVESHTAELHSLAFRDALTGLPNDAMFVQLLRDTLAGYGLRQKTAVLMVRILNLRSVRDSIGLAAANEVLLEATRRLKEVTKRDVLSRFEASTFAVAIPQTDPSLVTDAVNLICRRLEPLFVIGGRDIYLKPAIGVSLFPGDGTDADTLIRNAGAALSRAEVENVGYRFYAPEINAQAVRQLSLENNLRRALERNEFTVFYQPKVDIESRRVTGMEALLRWNSSELGNVPPGVFIPVAESTDLIVPIGEWSVRAVCEQTKAWCEQGFDLNVAVNLSARQFRDPTLLNKIWDTLIKTGLDPHSLTLEVTETSVLTDRDLAVKTLT